ncbi:response regulator [Rubellimicrobium arenae]|uniref:response regulator n=1 Tax=Rubellimicrobium arenae TaxID=2817372 RepID=UPI001B30622E|nr:response regulator [Rubellimicrobium arenae]
MAGPRPAEGKHVLVVEDEYMLADDLRRDLEEAGARVLGPVASLEQAFSALNDGITIDAAVLDINLGGEMVFPLAEALRGRGVPFVFVTGYDAWALPGQFRDVPCCDKPVDAVQLLRSLGLARTRGTP